MPPPANRHLAAHPADFDVGALAAALDAERRRRQLTWSSVARDIWAQSRDLNGRRHDHPISPATLTGMATRQATSCQHALFMLRRLGRAPEEFMPGVAVGERHRLLEPGPGHRLRWSLPRLYEALDDSRRHAEPPGKRLPPRYAAHRTSSQASAGPSTRSR
jgi:hypothetical protein